MASNDFHFVSEWQVRGCTCEEVFEILADLEGFPGWWSSVYLSVQAKALYDAHTKGWLPYSMRWQIMPVQTDEMRLSYPNKLVVNVASDFAGRGVWELTQNGKDVNIVYDWRITAHKPLLKYLSYLPGLKLVFGANHRWAMREGEKGLQAEIARRRELERELDAQNQL